MKSEDKGTTTIEEILQLGTIQERLDKLQIEIFELQDIQKKGFNSDKEYDDFWVLYKQKVAEILKLKSQRDSEIL